jgi:tetratricopeptide (TPR) repeat protein
MCLKGHLMGFQIFSGKSVGRLVFLSLIAFGIIMFSGCAGVQPMPERSPQSSRPAPEPTEIPDEPEQDQDYRMAASRSLSAEGCRLVESQDYDRAIRILERAVGIHPGDGRGYFCLAQAWMGKKDFNRAARFNEMALLYLRDDPQWLKRAREQKEEILNLKNGVTP